MIDAFEAGTPLTAHGRESEAQAALAGTQTALDGVVPEVEPETPVRQAAMPEAPAAFLPAAGAMVGREDEARPDLAALLAALQAQGREGEARVTPPAAIPSDLATGGAATAFDRPAMASGHGGVPAAGLVPSDAFPGAVASLEAGRDATTIMPAIMPSGDEPVARGASGAMALTADLPLPGAFPETVAQTGGSSREEGGMAAPSAAAAVRVLLREGGASPGPAAMALPADGHDAATALFDGSIAAAAPVPAAQSLVAQVVSQAVPGAPGGWDMAPLPAAQPAAGAAPMMLPPVPVAEATGTEGAAPALPFASGLPAAGAGADHPPIVVHATLHLDGSVLAQAVSEHIVTGMNGPLAGTGGFDPRRSYTPVEA